MKWIYHNVVVIIFDEIFALNKTAMYFYKVRKISILYFLINLPILSFSQKREYSLTGDIGVQGGELFHYNLILKDSTANKLTGYAYTFLNEGQDVKARITVDVDRVGKTLHIKEDQIIYNHGFTSKAQICLVESNLTWDENAQALSGALITRTAILGAECAKGSISFLEKDEINNLFQEPMPSSNISSSSDRVLPKPISPPKKPDKIIYDTLIATQPEIQKAVIAKVSEGKDKTYQWNTDTVSIEIWDKFKVDNDRIKVQYNGETVLEDYAITSKKKLLRLPINGNELNIISITALNEGNEPPNTVNIILHDGDQAYEVESDNAIGKTALIRIEKKVTGR